MAMLVGTVDALCRELLLFAAVGILIGGLDDLLVDLIWLWRQVRRRFAPDPPLAALGVVDRPHLAIFVPAWREANVIGPMLRRALAGIAYPAYRIYVGTYPNDPATIAEVAMLAEADPRIRLVTGTQPGPTTKAGNLNTMWRALCADEAAGAPRAAGMVLHDAEDVVHPDELSLHAALLPAHAFVQVPVIALIERGGGRWRHLISGHYADEFAEAHRRVLPVRAALGHGFPLAGVGCAIRRDALDRIAAHGPPFDAGTLTEDYELGLRLGAMGQRGTFARMRGANGSTIATRAYFPDRLDAAVTQKARWMTGIALAGWDRVGWRRTLDLGDHWMRLRDRRAPLAVLVLAAAYAGLLAAGAAALLHLVSGLPAPLPGPGLALLLWLNAMLLGWRLAARAAFTASDHGWREGLWAVPRALVANAIAMLAMRRAIARYLRTPPGAAPHWDKTDHVFPNGEAG